MEELDIIIEPELEFSLKKCGDVVPYGITPEEREKLAGIEENANNYTHPETHPASILDVVDVVNGSANKFFNERGEMVAVATSSIGVTGSSLYASTENSDVAGYKSLVGTPQPLETEITLTAKSSDGIVWGAKYLSAPFTEAVTIPTTAYGFDYWRKVSAANGTSRKLLRVFLYRAGVETNISAPLISPDIDDTEFTERQISYIFPELVLLAGDRLGVQEGFSTTHANNIALTYIVGDGRGWFMRLPLPLKHENLTEKNSEAAFQHVDTTTVKTTLAAADMVAIKDSVTGEVVLTPKSNLGSDNLIADYVHTRNKEVIVTEIDYATGTFTSENHGFVNNKQVVFATDMNLIYPLSVLPTGITIREYYVVNATANTFQLSTSLNGSPIVISSKSTSDLSKFRIEERVQTVTIIIPESKKVLVRAKGRSNRGSNFIYITSNIGHITGADISPQPLDIFGFRGGTVYFDIQAEFEITNGFYYATLKSGVITNSTDTTNTFVEKNLYGYKNTPLTSINSIILDTSAIRNGTILKIYKLK